MSKDREKRNRIRRRNYLLTWAILTLFYAYLSLHMAHIANPGENVVFVFKRSLAHIKDMPFKFLPIDTRLFFLYCFIMSFVSAVILLYFFIMAKVKDSDKNASGSAAWNDDIKAFNKKYNEPFGSENDTSGYGNMILAADLYLSMNGSATRRNAHQIVFGGSGAGKSYSLIKPNALQMNCSFIFTDPKGELLEELAHPLEENGYEIKIFNISKMHESMCYNPFNYIRDENGVRTMVKCIIDNTRGTDQNTGDPIWEDSMTALLQAISFYMLEELVPEERNFSTVMRMLRLAQVDENQSDSKSDFDKLFDALEEKNPGSMAVMSYKTFRIGTGKTLKSILITTMTRLDVFNMPSVADLTCKDTLHLEELGKKRQALFIIIPAADKTYNFLAATMYTQLFETMYYQAENECPHMWYLQKEHDIFLEGKTQEEVEEKAKLIGTGVIKEADDRFEVWDKKEQILIDSFSTQKSAEYFIKHAGGKVVHGKRRLPYDVRFMLDEFANIGRIPGFVEKLSTMRSYALSCTIILQNQAQLKKLYADDMGTVIGNCDTFIFLGSQEKEMIEYVEGFLSKTTKKQQSISVTTGKHGISSESYQYTQGNLMEFNEIREMKDNDCIVFIRGEKPFYAQKYNFANHPKYPLTGHANDDYKYVIKLDNRRKSIKTEEDTENEALEEGYLRQKNLISEPDKANSVLGSMSAGDEKNFEENVNLSDNLESIQTPKTEKEKEQAKDQANSLADIWEDAVSSGT